VVDIERRPHWIAVLIEELLLHSFLPAQTSFRPPFLCRDAPATLAQRPTSALFEDLRIARMLRGTRPVQVFLTVRKRPEFFFQAEVLFAGLR
jgi:hypothetical protein